MERPSRSKSRKIEPQDAFSGVRGRLNCSNRLAGAMENVIPGHPKEEGLFELVASRPLRLQDEHAQNGEKLLVPSWELRTLSEEVLEGQGARLECPEAARGSQESPGSPQERLRNGAAELQKNRKIEL